MGESYAGVYIPYFIDAILSHPHKLNFDLASISLGDGSFGNYAAMSDASVTQYLHAMSGTLSIPDDILEAFDNASSTCGFDTVMSEITYPPKGPITIKGDPEGENFKLLKRSDLTAGLLVSRQDDPSRSNSSITGGTDSCNTSPLNASAITSSIFSPCYGGCATFSTALDYLEARFPCFSFYNILYNCSTPNPIIQLQDWLSSSTVRKAIHAPATVPEFAYCNPIVLANLTAELVSPPAYHILPRIAAAGIDIHIYQGELDILLNHFGTELVLQNMTWSGQQGFLRKPATMWLDKEGKRAGVWGEERGLSYHLVEAAGHELPHDRPSAAFALVEGWVVGGSNKGRERRGYGW